VVRAILGLALFVGQAFIYNGITFNLGTLMSTFFGVASAIVPVFLVIYALGNFLGPLTLGRRFGQLIGTGERGPVALAFVIGSAVMALGGIAELFFGVKSEQANLEDIAKPLTAEDAEADGGGEDETGAADDRPERQEARRARERAEETRALASEHRARVHELRAHGEQDDERAASRTRVEQALAQIADLRARALDERAAGRRAARGRREGHRRRGARRLCGTGGRGRRARAGPAGAGRGRGGRAGRRCGRTPRRGARRRGALARSGASCPGRGAPRRGRARRGGGGDARGCPRVSRELTVAHFAASADHDVCASMGGVCGRDIVPPVVDSLDGCPSLRRSSHARHPPRRSGTGGVVLAPTSLSSSRRGGGSDHGRRGG
jgi:hypothetical protein